MENSYEKIVSKYGETAQIIKTIEELAELQKALAKYLNKDHIKGFSEDEGIDNIISEIIDVRIMLGQMVYIFSDDATAIGHIEMCRLESFVAKL